MRDRQAFMPPGEPEAFHPGGHPGATPGLMGGGARNVLVQTQRAYSLYCARLQTHSIELVRYIDATAFVSGSLMVRLQKNGTWPNGATFTVQLHNVSPAPDDPATLYTDGTVVATLSFDDSESAPLLKVDDFTTTMPGYLRCMLTATTSDIDGQTDFTIGINVVGRDG